MATKDTTILPDVFPAVECLAVAMSRWVAGFSMFRRRKQSWSKGLVAGIIAGAVGSWAMNAFQAGLAKLQTADKSGGQSEAGGTQENREEHDEPATVKAAVTISKHILH